MKEYKVPCDDCKGSGRKPSSDGPWTESCDCGNEVDILQREIGRRYTVVCYMRVDADDIESMYLEQANAEAEQARIMQPENIYRVEEVGDNDVVS